MQKNISSFFSIFFLLVFGWLVFQPDEAEAIVKFRRPLYTLGNPVYYSWYDHDSRANNTKRYDCTTNIQYEGHRGTDFKSATGTIIYAGASGSIYYSYNNCPTNGSLTSTCGSGFGNHIRMAHESALGTTGMISIYAHMKQGSPSGLMCGVKCGTAIGLTGNSGTSSAPHLHFEIRPNGINSTPIDPYSGSCSQTTSYWTLQNNPPSTTCLYNPTPSC